MAAATVASPCLSVLAALDPATGIARWHNCLDGPIIGGVATSPGLVIVGAGQYVEAFTSTTGSQLLHWNDTDPAWYYSVPTISNGRILIAKSSGIVHALGTTASGTP